MSEKQVKAIERAYELLGEATPFDYDCGEACGRRCCGGDENTGMWLLPGEEQLIGEGYTLHEQGDRLLAVCSGNCQREKRPFSCRIFPLFPQVSYDGEGGVHVRAAIDPRAAALCPIAAGELHVLPQFRRAVRRAARALLAEESMRKWLLESQEFLDDVAELDERLG